MSQKVNPSYNLSAFNCPICGAFSSHKWTFAKLYLKTHNPDYFGKLIGHSISICTHCSQPSFWKDKNMIYPSQEMRNFDLTHVPSNIANDYTEACLVLPYSAQASGALSRRCLQQVLRENGFKGGSLNHEIQDAIDNGNLPAYLSENIDYIRNIGNFSAHPQKDKNTGEIVPVESGEADWTLNVLENLFDFFYIQPAIAQIKKDEFNKKLKAAGKPEMK